MISRLVTARSASVHIYAVLHERRQTELRSETPPELARPIKRCLRKDPARRFQTMADLKVVLEELKEESDSGTLTSARTAAAPP